nr:actin-interacting protein 1 [Danaus plexippus plexippus]
MSYSNKYTFAALPRTQRGTPLVLGGDPKGKHFLYTNGNSVIIRDIENPAISDVYTEHSCQVNVAKYSPSGFYIASGDVSGKVRIWDTVNKEHILKNEFQPIGGPIKDIAWSADSQRMVVAGEGRERFGHVFMAETGTSVGEISGQSKPINSVDFRPARPFRIVTASEDNTLAVFEGPPFKFKCTKQVRITFIPGEAVHISGPGHGNQVNGMKACEDGSLLTCGIDDTLRKAVPASEGDIPTYSSDATPLGSQPKALDHLEGEGTTVVATVKELLVLKGNVKQSSLSLSYEPSCVTIDPVSKHVAVGGDDNKVHIYSLSDLSLINELEHLGPVTDARYSPNSRYLVACDAHRKIILYTTEEYKLAHKAEWGFHTARVNRVAWSPDSLRVVSGALDTCLIVWSVAAPTKHIVIKNAHPQSQITGVSWVDDETIVSVGQDANTRVWSVPNA